jgi:hypothetical protein
MQLTSRDKDEWSDLNLPWKTDGQFWYVADEAEQPGLAFGMLFPWAVAEAPVVVAGTQTGEVAYGVVSPVIEPSQVQVFDDLDEALAEATRLNLEELETLLKEAVERTRKQVGQFFDNLTGNLDRIAQDASDAARAEGLDEHELNTVYDDARSEAWEAFMADNDLSDPSVWHQLLFDNSKHPEVPEM